MSVQEAGGIPLAIGYLATLPIGWKLHKYLFRQPLLIFLTLWVAWVALSLLWSPDPRKGAWDLASLRFIWCIPALWLLMSDRPKLITAIAVGFLLGNLAQLILWAGHSLHIHALAFKDLSPGGRNPGWWTHPAEAGYILVGALGLHLPAAMMGRGRARLLAIGAAAATCLGLLATGTRGAWLAALALIAVTATLALASGRWNLRSPRTILAIAAAVGVLAIGWFALGDFVSKRAHAGISEGVAALREHRYESDTGARIKLALMAIEMFEQRPIQGHGAGSYLPFAETELRREGADDAKMEWWADKPKSAHNAWLHVAATIGLVGVVIALAIVYAALRGGFQGLWPNLGTYAAGPVFALIGMLLTTPFDVTYINSVPSAFVTVLFALCLMGRPRESQASIAVSAA
jgi:O-antigen ligase